MQFGWPPLVTDASAPWSVLHHAEVPLNCAVLRDRRDQRSSDMMRLSKAFVIAVVTLFAATSGASVAPSFAKGPSANGLQHSNKGGALRGLNRANHVAGVHGLQGRTNAANHHHH